jgi:hypothetical protein
MTDILAAPLTGTGTRALQFGVIVPGTTTVTVLPRTSGGGEFRITGVKNRKSVDISFTLPTQLNGPAGASIPLSFNGNSPGSARSTRAARVSSILRDVESGNHPELS